ncbi:hypothetical protein ABFS83_09G027500 [Erythranthe nasuta]
MANFFSLYNCCLLIFHLQLLFLSRRANAAAVDDICNKTKDPPLCLKGFATDVDGRSATADMKTLATVAIDVALAEAGKVSLDIEDHLVEEKDRKMFNIYLQCTTFYFHVTDSMGVMMDDWDQSNWADYKKQAIGIHADVDGVEALFNNSSPFVDGDRLVGIFADAMVLIADALMSP